MYDAVNKDKGTAYKAKIFDRIESNSSYTMHENELIDINQDQARNVSSVEVKDIINE